MVSKFATASIFAAFSCFTPAEGNAFLKKQAPAVSHQLLNESAIETRFLEEVKGYVGKGPLDDQLPLIREGLTPMWLSLPKNSHGRLGSAEARYALHRFFVQRHGWYIVGLDSPSAEASPAGVLSDRVPAFLMELFEEAFGTTGLMLHELAIFAATLERIIHDQSFERLEGVYRALKLSNQVSLGEKDVQKALETFVASLMLGEEKIQPHSLTQTEAFLTAQYPGWNGMRLFVSDVRETVRHLESDTQNPFVEESGMEFKQVERMAEQVSHRIGRFQDAECRELKDALLEKEDGDNSGRVLLHDFYQIGMEKGFHFTEKVDFLREIGALDESKAQPRLIVPNYILNDGQCLMDTGFYKVCCINECDGIVAQLERELASPKASPEKILAVLSKVSTSTTELKSPADLAPKLHQRLHEMARINGGVVQLHGRLFSQWLHFAFPRECPHPNLSGATSQRMTPQDWAKANGHGSHMKASEIESFIMAAANQESTKDADETNANWSNEEEIMYLPSETRAKSSIFGSGFVVVAGGLLAAGAAATAAVDAARRTGGLSACLGKTEKAHLV